MALPVQWVSRMSGFSPRLDVLPKAHRRLWVVLSGVPDEFTLYGGTALALQLGHRTSVDFNFFVSKVIDVVALEGEVPFLADARVIQREKNTLTAIVDRGAPVKVSFFAVPGLPRLAAPLVAEDNDLKIASLLDVAGTKASVIQLRAEARDYIDVNALIQIGRIGLPFALAAAKKLYGTSFNRENTLKALSCFDDGNLRELPEHMRFRLADAVRIVDRDHLPRVEDFVLSEKSYPGPSL